MKIATDGCGGRRRRTARQVAIAVEAEGAVGGRRRRDAAADAVAVGDGGVSRRHRTRRRRTLVRGYGPRVLKPKKKNFQFEHDETKE